MEEWEGRKERGKSKWRRGKRERRRGRVNGGVVR